MNKTNQAGWAIAVFVTASVALLWATGVVNVAAPREHDTEDEHAGHNHGAVVDNDHGDEADHDEGTTREDQDGCGGCGDENVAPHSDDGHRDENQESVAKADGDHVEVVGDSHDGCGGCGAEELAHDELEAAAARHCEHGVAIIDCDPCRYELGVVKLLPHVKALTSTTTVQRTSSGPALRLWGKVQLDMRKVAHIPALTAGVVSSVNAFQGDSVKEGDALAVLHSTELGEHQARWIETQATVKLARSRHERQKKLREKGVNSEVDLMEAEAQLQAAEAANLAASRRLELFGLTADNHYATQGAVGEQTIKAPISGVVLEQDAVKGHAIDAGQPLFVVADLSQVWVWAALYERDLPALKTELQHAHEFACRVRAGGQSGQVLQGVIETIEGQVDEGSRTVPVRIRVDNADRALQPGMFVEVEIPLGHDDHAALVVPPGAVLSDEGRHFVFTHWRDDFWLRRFVTPGAGQIDGVAILDGLAEGDTVIASGSFMLKSEVLREKMGAGCAH